MPKPSGPLLAPAIAPQLQFSALWAALTLCFLYCDYFELYRAGKLQSMLDGQMSGLGPATQGVLLGAGLLLAIPCLMVALSVFLRPGLARWLHIVFGLLFAALMALLLPRVWWFYQAYAVLEIGLCLAIVGLAWRWPRQPAGR